MSQQPPVSSSGSTPSANSSASASSALSPRSSTSRPDRRPLFPPPSTATTSNTQRKVITRPGAAPIPENVKSRSLFQSYLSLSGNTRIAFGVILGVVGIAGLFIDRRVLQDEKGVDEKPLIGVTMVDRPKQ
ncbi:hypothetical protein CI109_104599 [Kwoniella shandongensis]|uniref:Uncharacterized protein n=1 Tax=Kwoniella shandongensis TaxID=1734106 RepID=A0A5M6BT92_9TREE|nr:uncharacterized protein CI109_005510 [Kwoniella shandongensis]KAA5526078.1 hypothetical protein CI109_005510 [Kwoniella shandongensis]